MGNRARVGNYVTLQRGITYKGNLVGKPGPALLGLGSIIPGGGFREGDYKTYGGECPAKIMLRPGDLFVSLKGATKDGKMIGSIARVPQSVPLGRLTQDTVKLEFRNIDLEESNFLYWVLRTPQYRDYCASRATGSAVVALSRDDFLSYPVPILDTFRSHIVQILEALENKIESNRQMNATLEGMAQALFKRWFVDFDPVIDNALAVDNPIPDELAERAEVRRKALADGTANREAAKQFPAAFQLTEEMGWIPEGWDVSTVGNEVTAVGGGTPSTANELFWNGIHPFCTPKDMSSLSSLVLSDTERHLTDVGAQKISSGILPEGTLLMSSRAPIGYLAIAETPVTVNQGIIALLKNDKYQPMFLFSWLHSNMEKIIERANGSTFLEISKKNFKPIPFLRPNEEVLSSFNVPASSIHRKIVSCVINTNHLTNLRDTLLPKLISGELRIPEAESLVEEALA